MANVSMYKSDGQTFEVSDDRLEDFLEQYPNATKVEEKAPDLSKKVEMYYVKDGDKYTPYEVSGDRVEDFKKQHPEGRTSEGWKTYAEDLQRKIDAQNKRIRDAKDQQEKDKLIADQKEEKRRADLQQENTNKILSAFDKEYANQASRTWTKSRNDVIEEGKNFTLDQKIKWLNNNTSKTYRKELSFDEPEVLTRDEKIERAEEIEGAEGFIGPSAIVELPKGPEFSIFDVATEQPERAHISTLGDDYTTKMNNYYSDLKQLMNNPILNDSGEIDVSATQQALDNLVNDIPSPLTAKEEDIDFDLGWDQLSEEEQRRYNILLNEMESNPNFAEVQYDSFGRPIPQLVQGVDREEMSDNEKRAIIFNKIIQERQEKLDLYNKGELELSTEELSNIATIDPDFKDYVKRFIPDNESIAAEADPNITDSENIVNVINSTTQKAVQNDPRFQFIQRSVVQNVDKLAAAKVEELRIKYGLDKEVTQEGLEAVEKDFTDWYNNSISEAMQNNPEVTKLFQNYGIAVGSQFGEINQSYQRYITPSLRRIDNTIRKYEFDDSWKGEWKEWSAKIREQAIKLPDEAATWGNEFQIAIRDFFRAGAEARENYINKAIEDLDNPDISFEGESGDLTVNDAINLLGRDHELAIWKIQTGSSGNEKLNEAISIEQKKQTELEDDIAIDIEQMLDAYEATAKYRTYDSGKGIFTLEGFLDRVGGLVQQAPHMVPTQLGQLMVGASTVATIGSGGAASGITATTAAIGTGLIAAGSMVQGAMEYGGTYMDGVRRKLTAELGREPTADEYLKALKSGGYTDQTASLAAGAATVGVEFLSDYMTSKLTAGVGGKIAGTQVGRAILGNTFTRYLASVGVSGFGGMKLNAAQEYLTEGFQEYLGQVADNYIDKYTHGEEFTTVDNIFTSNIRTDEIHEAAKMGYKQGELFGGVALLGTSVGLSQIQQTYEQQAEDIAYKIDMRPGSKTSKAARAAFQKLKSKIKDDDSLSESQKRAKIDEISRIREAAMLVPSNVTGAQKAKLMNLIIEQRRLKNEIKAEDNADLSVNKIKRKGEVDKQIRDIIENADANSELFANSVLGPLQKGLEKASGVKFVVDPDQEVSPFAETEQDIDSYQKIDNLIADQDLDLNNRFDQKRILALAGGTIQSAFNRLYQEGGLLTRQEFKTRLENEYIQALTEYNADQDVNNQGIGQQTSNLFGLRANAVASENIRQQGDTISMSDEKAPQIGDTTQQQDFDAETQEVQGKRDKKYLGSNEKVSEAVGPEAKNEIKNQTSQEILNQANKGSTVSQIKSAINNMFGDAKARGGRGLWKTLGNKIGTMTKGYKNFVDNVVDAEFISQLPAAYLKQSGLGKILGIEKIGKSDKVVEKDGKRTYSRPDTFLLPGEITAEMVQKVKDYFKKDNPSRIRLLQKMSQEFAMESLQELKGDQDFMQKLQTALGDKQTAEEFMNDLEAQMDQRTLEDSTLDVTTPVKNANEASSEAFNDIVTEENLNDFKDKDVLDRAIEYFDSLEDDYKNTLGTNPIQLFTGAIKAALKLTRAAIKAGATLKQAAAQFAKSFRHALKYPAKLYSKLGKSARLEMKQLVAGKNVKLFNPGRKGTLNAEQRQQRRIGTIVSHFKLGPEFTNSSVLTGSENSLYNTIDEVNNDIDGEIDAALAAELQKQGIPLTQLDNGNFKYDKSQATSIDQNNTLQDSRAEQNGVNAYKNWSPAKILQKIKDPAWREQQRNKLKLLKKIAKVIQADIKANPQNIAYWASWLNSQSTQSSHPVRVLAPITFFNTSKGPASLFRAEHSLPSNQVSTMIMDMAIRGEVDNDFKIIEQDYFQGKLLVADDNKLKTNQEGRLLQRDMPNIYFTGPALTLNPKTWLRYLDAVINDNKGGINMNELVTYNNDGTITSLAEKFGLPLNKNEYTYGNNRTNFGLIKFQNELLYKVAAGDMSLRQAKSLLKVGVDSGIKVAEQQMVDQNTRTFGTIFTDLVTPFSQKKTMLNSFAARIKALKFNKKRKGLSAFDLDDTLALTKEKVLYTLPNGKKGELTAGEFAVQYEGLLEQGAEFDYSNFDNVSLQTQKGPLAGTALKRQAKYGAKDIFVVTARPNAAQGAIKTFLDSIGLNIPLENIITLEDGSPQVKADWLLSKAEQGYNDFYFADDSALNVQTVQDILSQIDVKSRVQQAITDKSTRIDQEMNQLIEDASGILASQEVTDVEAALEGRRKDKGFFKRVLRQFTITASADDFLGLGYKLFGFGEKGTRQQKWFIETFIKPYNKAEQALISAKMAVAKDFAALKAKFPTLKSSRFSLQSPLLKDVGYKSFNKSQAVRVYLWNKQGMEIPGMSRTDIDGLVAAVESDPELNVFADELQLIQKGEQYPGPGAAWLAGDIKSDIISGLDKTFRADLLTEWKENVDIAFSEKNMNKLEAAFGSKYVEALRDSLKRMESGTNRPTYTGSGSRQVNEMMDWLNGSVAVAMFLNVRSGTLQMLSNVNFINWGDNNIYAAAKAFLSKDYVPTVLKLMNSDYLVNRRDGLKINVNEAELAAANQKDGFKGMLNFLLDKGFVLTRIFDSLAIATGGATFYINRTKSLLKQTNPETNKLYTQQEAETKAFDDFYAIAEETQQSSNPSKISSQQASMFGRVILSFQNVTMQYNRKAKKMLLDLVNRRKRPGMTQRESDLSNLSGVIYYVGMQNLVFNSLQQALFALAFDDEEEKERDKVADTLNGMLDSLLFGLGFGGAIISTVKNVARKLISESERESPEYQEAVFSLFDISPVIDTKIRNIRNGLKTFSWDMKEIKNRGWSLDNPAYIAISSIVSGFTNIPVDRLFRKINNIRQATDENVRTFERIALLLGWSGWNFGLPYWGRESTIEQEAANEEKLKEDFKASVKKAKADGFTKRVPFTGKNSWQEGIPKGLKEGVDYVAIKRYDGIIQYYKKP